MPAQRANRQPPPELDTLIEQTAGLLAATPTLAHAFPDLDQLRSQLGTQQRPRAVYLLGTIKSGKSTLVNALLGQDVMPRGAGVKTFNLCRASNRASTSAQVLFHSGELLRERLQFDYRLLGFDVTLPEDPWAADAGKTLRAIHAEFQRACADDGRLQGIAADGDLAGLLPRALARVNRTMAGLAEVALRFDSSTRQQIRTEGALAWSDDQMQDYLDWTRSPDMAALIREIRLGLPFPETTPQTLELVDCQGSDSLNPLDFADVEVAMQQADLIVYVIQSRLGLRQADRDLLRHLAAAGAANRVLPVMNVEAFDPVPALELETLTQRCNADLHQCLGLDVDVLPVNALHTLDTALGDDDSLQLMQKIWDKRDAGDCLAVLVRNHNLLLQELAGTAKTSADSTRNHQVALAISLREQLRHLASALLSRDQDVLGLADDSVERPEAELAVQRIVAGERDTLRKKVTKASNAAFAPEAPLQQEIDQFLAVRIGNYVEQRPLPDELHNCDRPGPVIDAAAETFNSDWLDARARVRTRELRALEDKFRERLADGITRIVRLVPQSLPGQDAEELDLLLGDAATQALVADASAGFNPPRLFSPVVLPTPVRHALAAEFQGRRALAKVGDKVRRKANSKNSAAQPPQQAKLWRHALQACFKAAAEQRSHAVANACENYKHRYFHPLAAAVLQALENRLLLVVDRRYDQLDRLDQGNRLLLNAKQRKVVEDYLGAL